MKVREAIIAVTLRCNARCRMCDIWSTPSPDEMEPSAYYHLPSSLRNVNITGGEPLLREDLPEIVEVIAQRCPGVRVVISTHGFLTQRITKMLPRLRAVAPRLAFRVSLDSIGAAHDQIRGVTGAYRKAMETLDALRRGGVRDLGVGFTMMRGNEEELLRVHDLARRNRWHFTATTVHSSPIFFGDQTELLPDSKKAAAAFGRLSRRQWRSAGPRSWFRAYFSDGLVDRLSGRPRPIRCQALESFFYLDPAGTVYTCHILDEALGPLQTGYETLVRTHQGAREAVASCPEHCWMTCTVAPMMRRDAPRLARVILAGKIAAHRKGKGEP